MLYKVTHCAKSKELTSIMPLLTVDMKKRESGGTCGNKNNN